MALKNRIIPTLLWKDYSLVKGESFNSWRRIGSILPAVKVYNKRDVDELILLDISARDYGNIDYPTLADIAKVCSVPLTYGGGIRTLEDALRVFDSGVDKISINTECYSNPKLIEDIAKKFGSQSIVISIDAKDSGDFLWECYSHSGSKNEYKNAPDWAKKVQSMGAGEILVTSINLDGTMKGYDIELISAVSNSVTIPVIASGGCRDYIDMEVAIKKGNASAVAASSIFQFTESTPAEAKSYLESQGIPTRKGL